MVNKADAANAHAPWHVAHWKTAANVAVFQHSEQYMTERTASCDAMLKQTEQRPGTEQ